MNMKLTKKSSTIQNLKKQGLKIRKEKLFLKFLMERGNLRIIQGYARFLQDSKKEFLEKTTSKDLVNFVNLDLEIGLKILEQLLLFEQKFNTILINTLFAKYKLEYNHILNLKKDHFLNFKDADHYQKCYTNLYINVKSSNFCSGYNFKSIYHLPLMILSLTWKFYDLILFYEALEPELQKQILENMGFKNLNILHFIEIAHLLRRIRNMISHNDFLMLYRTIISNELAVFFEFKNNVINIGAITKMIDKFNNTKNKFTLQIAKIIKQKHFKLHLRRKIGNLLGVELHLLNADD